MNAPSVEYVTTHDGQSIAYGVSGAGRPLVFVFFGLPHIQLSWQAPGILPWLEGLAARFRLVQYDPRGSGMSTRNLAEDYQLADAQLDLDAVVDRLGLDQFVLFGAGLNAKIFLQYALRHPERLVGLVLAGLPLGMQSLRAPGMFQVLPSQDWETFQYSIMPRDLVPSERQQAVAIAMQTFKQQDFPRSVGALTRAGDNEPELRRLTTPTLRRHVANIMTKTDAANRTEVASYAHRNDLLSAIPVTGRVLRQAARHGKNSRSDRVIRAAVG